jgi:flagellar biosynthesis protein
VSVSRTVPIAVALTYEQPNAPKVVAIGRGAVGEAIIELARKHGVPLEQNPALAEALSHVEVDTEIPEALYRAVAEIIGFILVAAEDPRVRRTADPVLRDAG